MELNTLSIGSSFAAAKFVNAELPAIIYTHGENGSGRQNFLLNLAQQVIEAGAGLIVLDGSASSPLWMQLASAAANASRADQCLAMDSRISALQNVSLESVVNDGAILWCGMPILESPICENNPDTFVGVTQFLTDLQAAILSRIDRPQLMVILSDLPKEALPAIKPLIEMTNAGHLSLIFSSASANVIDEALIDVADCCILGRNNDCEESERIQQFCGREFDLTGLGCGDAIVLLESQDQDNKESQYLNKRALYRVALNYFDDTLMRYVKPANLVVTG